MTYDYDVVVIGSGFGGSVAALRLTEKGYRVAVLDMGRRWAPTDFPPNNTDAQWAHITDWKTELAPYYEQGVNPSFTITAQAERAMSFWPNNGEPDPRPGLGEPYRRITPVPPHHPTVPEHAPGALRLAP